MNSQIQRITYSILALAFVAMAGCEQQATQPTSLAPYRAQAAAHLTEPTQVEGVKQASLDTPFKYTPLDEDIAPAQPVYTPVKKKVEPNDPIAPAVGRAELDHCDNCGTEYFRTNDGNTITRHNADGTVEALLIDGTWRPMPRT
ncbi:MAG: hypothetical protein AAF497_00910 [Planctomycetota bacterium]